MMPLFRWRVLPWILAVALGTQLASAQTERSRLDLDARTAEIIRDLSAEQKAAQLILVYFPGADFALQHEFGAVLVMQNMLRRPHDLLRDLQRLQEYSSLPVFVAIDQEGGKVNRIKPLRGFRTTPSAETLGQIDRIEISNRVAPMAEALQRMGLNMNLAPVLDPAHNYLGDETLMAKDDRAFGRSAEYIITPAREFIRTFHDHGVMTINKHFPGYDVVENSDHELATSEAPFDNILANTASFAALARESCGVMMSSIVFSQYDDTPAVLSPFMVEWARVLYQHKLIITDDLWGVALRGWADPDADLDDYPDEAFLTLVKKALIAGNDQLMVTYPAKAVLMRDAIADWIRTDPALATRVDESLHRIVKMKLTQPKNRCLSEPDFLVD